MSRIATETYQAMIGISNLSIGDKDLCYNVACVTSQDRRRIKIKRERFMSNVLIAAFPGTGKSYFYKNVKKGSISDSDSSEFPKDKFPTNYIDHIEKIKDEKDIVLISTHKEVRDELVKRKLKFFLVYPEINLKDLYIERYKLRGSPDGFVKLMNDKWKFFIKELQEQEECIHIVLKKNEYLSDVISKILLK